MARPRRRRAETGISFEVASEALEAALAGSARREILEQLLTARDFAEALGRLRAGMRAHGFRTAAGRVDLSGVVTRLDRRTREDGFNILQAWDPKAHRFTGDSIPVLMLDYLARTGSAPHSAAAALAILLDCYFLYLLALLAMRAWDEEDPNAALDRITHLLGVLQGPGGSGRQFVEDAGMLLFVAIAQYQPDEQAYDRLLERVYELDEAHRVSVALAGAANLGSHLRWGFQYMYRRDPERMRADNVVDYPWLLFSLATLMRAYERMREEGAEGEERERAVEGLLNGLTADPWAFSGELPSCLTGHETEHAYFRRAWARHAQELQEEFEAHRPTERAYSPVSFHFNFMHNALVAAVTVAMLQGSTPNLPFEALFTRERADGPISSSPEVLARMLMEFSGGDPSRLGARGAVLVTYDPALGRRGYDAVEEVARGLRPEAEPVLGPS